MSASSSTSHPLTIDDLRVVLEELANEAASKWYHIGIQLKIKPDRLTSLRQQSSSDHKAVLCQGLVIWLKSGNATWEGLCDALESKTVEEKALADKLRNDYCTPEDLSMEEGEPEQTGEKSKTETPSKSTGTKRLVRKFPPKLTKDDFCQAQKSDRFCFKCKMVPTSNPQRLLCQCQRIYCESCSQKVTECKKCKKPAKFEKDRDLHSKIQKVKIKCPNRTRGCTWKGIVSKLKDHLARPDCEALKVGKKSGGKGAKQGEANKPAGESSTGGKNTSGQCGNEKASGTGKSKLPRPKRIIEDTKMTPPLNLVMQNASYYLDSGELWISDTFHSHQLGYKLCLAVKLQRGLGDDSIDVTLAVTSPGVESSPYLDYPRIGNATLVILNSAADISHESVEPFFMLENKSPTSFPDICEQTEISRSFIQNDCLFIRVNNVGIEGGNVKIWLLDPKHPIATNSET